MWKPVTVFCGIVLGAAPIAEGRAVAQDRPHETRHMGRHEHGHVTVNMAIEGNRVLIELHAPGADIVGFEHPARSAAEKDAVEKAEALLEAPFGLIALPGEAECRVATATVSVAGEEHGHGAADRGERHGGHDEARHTEFRAEYALDCARVGAIRRMAFPFFRVFPRTREIEVTVIGPSGQRAFEIGPEVPEIVLEASP